MKTRNIVWHGMRTVALATRIAKGVLKRNPDMRQAKKPCPNGDCKFEILLHNGYSIWCTRCGLMVPADAVYSTKTNRRVRF